jgi:class 3 adenylate cyclase
VTVVFCDLQNSTALAERLDPEAFHELKQRYFGAMSAEIARHGGKVEKYIGDAIMAVFGLPQPHEDDALRAVRAATGMQAELHRVNKDLSARYGVVLANRTGVNTGEVVATDDPAANQKLATGDAVNVAARLEQAAPVGEIYLGEAAYRLVRDAVEVEAVEPLELKGKSERLPAYRLISVNGADGTARNDEAPLVGREDELAAIDLALSDMAPRAFGPAGHAHRRSRHRQVAAGARGDRACQFRVARAAGAAACPMATASRSGRCARWQARRPTSGRTTAPTWPAPSWRPASATATSPCAWPLPPG